MHKFKHASYCSLLKPKITKYRKPNNRNAKGSSVTTSFHLSWGEETFLKAKKGSKFRRRASLHDRVFKLILHAEAKGPSFSTTFAVILSAVALPIVPKVEFNFEAIMYITILFSKVLEAAQSPWSVFKSHLKAQRSSCFHGSWRLEKFFTRRVWGLCTP